MTKTIVTDKAGFIGSHLVEQLVKQGVNVEIYDGYQIKTEFREPRAGNIRNSTADCTLAREKLGLTKTVDLKTGIRDLIEQEGIV